MLREELQSHVRPIEWYNGALRILDQTELPGSMRFIETSDWRDVSTAIRTLAVRGAPLIGIAAAYALALAARRSKDLGRAAAELESTRPTAVNLRWAIRRVLAAGSSAAAIEAEAISIHNEQIEADQRMGQLGAELLSARSTVVTHCNTGSLATGGIGTALGVIKTAARQGKEMSVLVDETRPLLQGARLTSWELMQEGIAHQIIVDAAAAGLIARGDVHAVIVGADRIAANGDVANKVGTYGLALAASAHRVPFYVVAPVSTIDPGARSGDEIDIEERSPDEVLEIASTAIAPAGSMARNPAFDITTAHLITAIVTDRGVLRPPFGTAMSQHMREAAVAQ